MFFHLGVDFVLHPFPHALEARQFLIGDLLRLGPQFVYRSFALSTVASTRSRLSLTKPCTASATFGSSVPAPFSSISAPPLSPSVHVSPATPEKSISQGPVTPEHLKSHGHSKGAAWFGSDKNIANRDTGGIHYPTLSGPCILRMAIVSQPLSRPCNVKSQVIVSAARNYSFIQLIGISRSAILSLKDGQPSVVKNFRVEMFHDVVRPSVDPFPLPARNRRSKRMALCSGHHPDRGPSHVERETVLSFSQSASVFRWLPFRPSPQAVPIEKPSGCLSLL